jgi:hypothetical protein
MALPYARKTRSRRSAGATRFLGKAELQSASRSTVQAAPGVKRELGTSHAPARCDRRKVRTAHAPISANPLAKAMRQGPGQNGRAFGCSATSTSRRLSRARAGPAGGRESPRFNSRRRARQLGHPARWRSRWGEKLAIGGQRQFLVGEMSRS